MISDRLHRAIRLIMLLRQSEGLSLREIAHWLDCSQRTVYRDLQLLKASGFEVEWSPQGYRIRAIEELPQAVSGQRGVAGAAGHAQCIAPDPQREDPQPFAPRPAKADRRLLAQDTPPLAATHTRPFGESLIAPANRAMLLF